MKRLVFIVEGQTEVEFINKVVIPHFNRQHKFYSINVFCIQTSIGHKGGFAKYSHLQKDIKKSLRKDKNVIVTTFLDFFRIPSTTPKYDEMEQVPKLYIDSKIEVLEKGMAEDINDYRFIPYIQKHEFEALLFSDNCGFKGLYDNPNIYNATEKIINQYPNPEDINNHPDTSPSKRLIKILKDNGEYYDKVTEGNLIAEDIGITKILNKCPRFRDWIMKLAQAIQPKDQ